MKRILAGVLMAVAWPVAPLEAQLAAQHLVVVVTDRSGEAVPGARVTFIRIQGDTNASVTGITDARGSAGIAAAEPGQYIIRIQQRSMLPVSRPMIHQPGMTDTLRVRVAPQSCIVDVCRNAPPAPHHLLIVVADSTGAPLAGAFVNLLRVDGAPFPSFADTTRIDGTVALELPQSGGYRVSVRALGKTTVIQNFTHVAQAFDTVRVGMRAACTRQCGVGLVHTPRRDSAVLLPPRAAEPARPAIGGR